ncbi:OLC1v1002506C1 [Oldenlandia corymbosa var. corymbosa]|uniref:OLC1v1002506C1 n=1 Tax=Oldenlandia corymbosa var. corymbosa TaxID=529605 RepID=A0AAV1D8E4_OLDCO|nr:OLC1v1002506C1 [Oldenlandia corymbosa var. corymbosa]
MAKVSRGRRRIASRQCRATPYTLPHRNQSEAVHKKRCSKALVKKDWEDATCSVCMEYPHNAVLLLCSSHDKGCRPYMCGTSFRFSNCLDQYRKAYTKVTSTNHGQNLGSDIDRPAMFPLTSWSIEKCEVTELACPLCRGQVKGWTVVEQARDYLNGKKRSCMQDCCSFVGTYKELRKHVKADHPSAKPREVDPLLEQKWRRLEREREREDVISTITSSMPGAVVFGDYVIEGGHYGFVSDGDDGFDDDPIEQHDGFEVGIDRSFMLFLMRTINQAGNVASNRGIRRPERNSNHPTEVVSVGSGRASPLGRYGYSDEDSGSDNDDGAVNARGNNRMSLVRRLRDQGRVLLGHSGRRRRRREARNQREDRN